MKQSTKVLRALELEKKYLETKKELNERIKKDIKESGYKIKYVCNVIELTPAAFYARVKKYQLSVSEIYKIYEVIGYESKQ